MAAVPESSAFEPLMTLYLTDGTTAEDVREAKACRLRCSIADIHIITGELLMFLPPLLILLPLMRFYGGFRNRAKASSERLTGFGIRQRLVMVSTH